MPWDGGGEGEGGVNPWEWSGVLCLSGDAPNVLSNFAVNTFFKDFEGPLIFSTLCWETRGRGVAGG